MEKQNFKFKIKESLNERTPDILSKIKNSSEFKVPVKQKRSLSDYFSYRKMSYSLASVFVLAILVSLVFSSRASAPVVASTITVDINPSIQITLDENDFVINVTAVNDDGEAIISHDIKYRGLTLDRCLEIIIEKAHEEGFIVNSTEENVILIRVDSENAEIKTRIEAQVEIKLQNEVSRYAQLVRIIKENGGDITQEELKTLIDIANENRISVAKLLLINKIVVLDDSYTLLDLKDEGIRDLYILHYRLLAPIDNIDDFTQSEIQELVGIAQQNHITVAKLLLINKIIELDDSQTIEALKDFSLGDLHAIHYRLLNIDYNKNNNSENGNDDPGR